MSKQQLDDLKAKIEKARNRLNKPSVRGDEQAARLWLLGELAYLAKQQGAYIAALEAQLEREGVSE